MKQKKHNTLSADFRTEFKQRINLYNLIGQDKACSVLMTLVEELYWEQEAIRQLRPVMLYGLHSTSAVAQALANSLGSLEHHEIAGNLIGCGMCLEEYIGRMDEFVSYHISSVNSIGYIWHSSLFRLVKEFAIEYPDMNDFTRKRKKRFRGQLVLSASKPSKFSAEMEKYCSAVVNLNDSFCDDDIADILNQRIEFNSLIIEDKDRLISDIVRVGCRDVELSIKLLEWAYRSCRATGQGIITAENLNSAIKMWA